jgi:hypothetical protein
VRKTATLVIFLFFSAQLWCQGGHLRRFENLYQPDSLCLEISSIQFKKGHSTEKIDTFSIEYDLLNQYPYYTRTNARVNFDSVITHIKITRIPKMGSLLLFWFDSHNTPVCLSDINISRLKNNDNLEWITPSHRGGVHYLCALLSNEPVRDAIGVIEGMEFSSGSFFYRQKKAFGPGLINAKPEWRLIQSHRIGVEWEPVVFDGVQLAYLPLLFVISEK